MSPSWTGNPSSSGSVAWYPPSWWLEKTSKGRCQGITSAESFSRQVAATLMPAPIGILAPHLISKPSQWGISFQLCPQSNSFQHWALGKCLIVDHDQNHPHCPHHQHHMSVNDHPIWQLEARHKSYYLLHDYVCFGAEWMISGTVNLHSS